MDVSNNYLYGIQEVLRIVIRFKRTADEVQSCEQVRLRKRFSTIEHTTVAVFRRGLAQGHAWPTTSDKSMRINNVIILVQFLFSLVYALLNTFSHVSINERTKMLMSTLYMPNVLLLCKIFFSKVDH